MATSQIKDFKDYGVSLKFHKGFVLNHNEAVAQLANQHPSIFEIDISKKTNGSRLWHQVHHYPNTGISLNIVFLDPAKPLGNMASLVFYMSKPLLQTARSRLEFRIGIGPGYAGKPFDLYTNPKNNMISSRLNFCLNGRINYLYKLGKYINLNTGIGIIHFSNGTVKLPNQGINIPSIHLGIGWNGKARQVKYIDSLPALKKKTTFEIMTAFGIKEQYPILGKKYIASTISAYFNRRLNYKSSLMVGLDLFYDPSIERLLKNEKISFSGKLKVAVMAGHELYFGKLSLLTQLGLHIYDPHKTNVALYERYGFKYSVLPSLFFQMTMKIFYGSVDYVEWGTGWRF